jgi:hypothetical protein
MQDADSNPSTTKKENRKLIKEMLGVGKASSRRVPKALQLWLKW